jgi:hypothetical protein
VGAGRKQHCQKAPLLITLGPSPSWPTRRDSWLRANTATAFYFGISLRLFFQRLARHRSLPRTGRAARSPGFGIG